VLANPPFNVNAVDKERLKDMIGAGRRFPFGLPRTDNANYLWIQLFYSSLNAKGRAGFVMANSASDARASEQELRQKLIEARAVDVMVAVGPNMFYTVTLPCTLWFLDKGKAKTKRADTVLFIDARHIYRQVDRAHRDWPAAQIGFIANLVRLYRGEALDYTLGGKEAEAKIKEMFSPSPLAGEGRGEGEIHYRDIPGLCKAATLTEIEAQGWSLNPGRYVGVAPGEEVSDEDFKEQIEELNEELESLNLRRGNWKPPSPIMLRRYWENENRTRPQPDRNLRGPRPANRRRHRILASTRSPTPAGLQQMGEFPECCSKSKNRL
jgi:type I restriction enzyme M protein